MKSDYLWFLYQQGVELAARFDLYLDEVAGLCSLESGAETELVQYFRDELEPLRRELARGMTELADTGPEIQSSAAKPHISTYQTTAAQLQALHFDLRFFPVQPPIPPEVYVLLTDFFRPKTFPQIQPVVTYFPDHNFEELDMYSLRKGGEAQVVLRMPYVEFRNPLMWTNLIHEMGHALDAPDVAQNFSNQFFDRHPTILGDKRKIIDWATEFYADSVALSLAGPAYLCAFIAWHLTRDPKLLQQQEETHPPSSERVLVMKEHLEGQTTHMAKWRFILDVFTALQPLPVELPAPQKLMADEARSNVAADGRLTRCSGDELLAAKEILDGLDAYTPVSSRCKASKEEIEELAGRINSSEFRSPGEFFSAIKIMQEEPNTSCAIINAAWEWKLGMGLEKFRTIFTMKDDKFKVEYKAPKGDLEQRYQTYKNVLLNFETRLRKSVEVAKLHDLWRLAEQSYQTEAEPSIHVSPASKQRGTAPKASVAAEKALDAQKSNEAATPVNVESGPSPLLSEKQIIRRLLRRDAYRLVVTPILSLRDQIQPTSIDLRLGTEFELIKSALFESLNVLEDPDKARATVARYMEKVHVRPEQAFVLHPGEFALGSTLEYFKLPSDLAGRLDGKSTWGRVGLQIHSTAGFVDPGFEGALTFELQNVGRVPIPLYPGMRVAQICFLECEESSIPYSQKGDGLYGGNPGLLSTQFFKLPDQRRLQHIQDILKKEQDSVKESRKKA